MSYQLYCVSLFRVVTELQIIDVAVANAEVSPMIIENDNDVDGLHTQALEMSFLASSNYMHIIIIC